MSKRLERVIAIRDRALILLKEHGEWHEMQGAGKSLEASVGNVKFSHRTPFSGIREVSPRMKYNEALFGKTMLPYGLDIWAGKKVLNVEWDNEGNVEIVSFTRGEWENEFS